MLFEPRQSGRNRFGVAAVLNSPSHYDYAIPLPRSPSDGQLNACLTREQYPTSRGVVGEKTWRSRRRKLGIFDGDFYFATCQPFDVRRPLR
jgi:hypothetical protein